MNDFLIKIKMNLLNVSANCLVLGGIVILLSTCQMQNSPEQKRFGTVPISKDLASDFKNPPLSAQPRAFWWWLEGNIDKEGILHDLSEMKRVGIAGAIVFDAGSSSYQNMTKTEPGPRFMGEEWRSLFKYAEQTADSLGLELSFNIGSGWNDGGPWVTPEYAAKKITWSEITVEGPKALTQQLPIPANVFTFPGDSVPYFRSVATLAMKFNTGNSEPLPPIKYLELKAVERLPGVKAEKDGYDWDMYLEDTLPDDPRYDARIEDITDISDKVDEQGNINWNVPAGKYIIFRFGYTGTGARVSTYSPGGGGLAIDYMNTDAMDLQFKNTVDIVLSDLKDTGIHSLKYLHDDSWELGAANWTPTFTEEFEQIEGYNPIKYLPVLAGKIIENRDISNRFLYDFRRVIADLIAKNHYVHFRALAHQNNLGLHSESGGPHPAPIDALKNLGIDDIPMGEYWARAKTHRVEDFRRIYVKQSACAAHIYGKPLVQAEGFTSIGPHWEVDPWHLKPTLDRAFCEGLNRHVFHTFTHSPESAGKPGNEYFAGTHFNPNITWWDEAPAFTQYIARSSLLLQQGKFVGDVLYYYGDNVPNQVHLKRTNPSLGEGYDYDVVNTDVILNRLSVRNHRLFLPDSMTYAILVLPDRKAIPYDVLLKINDLVRHGATIIGPKPEYTTGLKNYTDASKKLSNLADVMWSDVDGKTVMERKYYEGKIIWGKNLRTVLEEMQVTPDFSYQSDQDSAFIDYIHRTTKNADIYFIANRKERDEHLNVEFRIKDRIPELWYPDNGTMIAQTIYTSENDRIKMPLRLDPYGSVFVVFQNDTGSKSHYISIDYQGNQIFPMPEDTKNADAIPEMIDNSNMIFAYRGKYGLTDKKGNNEEIEIVSDPSVQTIDGNWQVAFDPKWGGPSNITFDSLISWPDYPLDSVKYYSGTATYTKDFKVASNFLTPDKYQLMLDLGTLYNLAEVYVNGQKLGVLWKKPFRIDISKAVKAGENHLEIKVVNLWPNRIIGDQFLPEDQRFTKTNVAKFTQDYPLRPSGLLGPVKITFYPEYQVGE